MLQRVPATHLHRIQYQRVITCGGSLRLFTTGVPACSDKKESGSSHELPPIIYTYLPEPLAYVRGLHLQESIIQHRLRARRKLVLNSLSDPLDAPPSARGREGGGDLRSIQTSADVLLLLQHKPVYTAGRREKASEAEGQNAEGERLKKLGADWVQTLRGGQTTYHGPGQMVGYPILDLGVAGLTARDYVCHIERFLKSLFTDHFPARLSIPPIPIVKTDQTGSFVTPTTKIASVGVHIRHRLTSHGFAFNVTREPERWFANVIACGLASVRATSIQAEVQNLEGEAKPREVDINEEMVKATAQGFGQELGRTLVSIEEAIEMGGKDEELANEARKVRQLVKEALELPLDKLRLGEH